VSFVIITHVERGMWALRSARSPLAGRSRPPPCLGGYARANAHSRMLIVDEHDYVNVLAGSICLAP